MNVNQHSFFSNKKPPVSGHFSLLQVLNATFILYKSFRLYALLGAFSSLMIIIVNKDTLYMYAVYCKDFKKPCQVPILYQFLIFFHSFGDFFVDKVRFLCPQKEAHLYGIVPTKFTGEGYIKK